MATIDGLRAACDAYRQAHDRATELIATRNQAIIDARQSDIQVRTIAHISGLTPARIHDIIEGR